MASRSMSSASAHLSQSGLNLASLCDRGSPPNPNACMLRAKSRCQLAESAWLVSLGCSGGAQRYYGDHLHIFQRWLQGKPILRKIGRFPLCACGDGVNLPHVAKHAFGDQMGPNVQKAMPPGSPSHQGLKNSRVSQKIFLIF